MNEICISGKQCYPTAQVAWRVIQHRDKNSSKTGFAYRCRQCRQWHTTYQNHHRAADGFQRRAALYEREALQ